MHKSKKHYIKHQKSKSGNKSRKIYRRIYLIIFLIFFIGWAWLIFYSQYFEIKNIEVRGNNPQVIKEIKTIAEQQIKTRQWLIFPQKNFWLFNKEVLKNKLTDKYFLDILSVKKSLFNTLKIHFQEKVSKLIWISGDEFYYLNTKGQIISQIPFTGPMGDWPRIYDTTGQLTQANQAVMHEDQVKFIIEIFTQVPLLTDLKITGFQVPTAFSSELTALLENDKKIYFSTDNDCQQQINNLIVVYQKKLRGQSFEYIDLRFGEKVYYK